MPIRITSKKDGFWRCGVQHFTTPTVYPDDRFTPDQLEQLKADPMLIVDIIPEDKPKTAKSAGTKTVKGQDSEKSSSDGQPGEPGQPNDPAQAGASGQAGQGE